MKNAQLNQLIKPYPNLGGQINIQEFANILWLHVHKSLTKSVCFIFPEQLDISNDTVTSAREH